MKEKIQQLLTDGGPMLYVILAFLFVGLILFVERFLYLHRARVDTFELLRGLMNQLRNRNVKEAIVNCDVRTGPVGEIFRTAIEHWNEGESGIRYAVEETVRLLLPRLERNMKLLQAIAAMTPVMGMLGTLFALINIFARLKNTTGQFSGMSELAPYISNALICTAAGLIASLLCQLFHAILVEKLDKQLEEMSKGAAEMTYFLAHNPAPEE